MRRVNYYRISTIRKIWRIRDPTNGQRAKVTIPSSPFKLAKAFFLTFLSFLKKIDRSSINLFF